MHPRKYTDVYLASQISPRTGIFSLHLWSATGVRALIISPSRYPYTHRQTLSVHKRDDKKARTTRKYDNKRLKGWAEDVRAMELAVPNPRSEEGRQQLNQAAAPFAQRREVRYSVPRLCRSGSDAWLKHAAACREWHNAQKQEHKDHLEHLREKRALQ